MSKKKREEEEEQEEEYVYVGIIERKAYEGYEKIWKVFKDEGDAEEWSEEARYALSNAKMEFGQRYSKAIRKFNDLPEIPDQDEEKEGDAVWSFHLDTREHIEAFVTEKYHLKKFGLTIQDDDADYRVCKVY